MCGRFERITPIQVLATLFDCPAPPPETPTHYNIAPTQPAAVVRVLRASQETGRRELAVMRWGLIPSWADDPAIGNRLINARSETAADKPSFRNAFKQRRCLVPVDGFYEWQATGKKTKQPHLIRLKDGRPFALAGLWEQWTAPDGELVESFTILTTDANAMMRPIHDRMPVIVGAADYDRWLNAGTPLEEVRDLLRQYPAEQMESFPVSTVVNNPRNETPECAAPVSDGPSDLLFAL